MRRYDLAIDTIHHIVLRGARGSDIMPASSDKWGVIKRMYYENDANRPRYWIKELHKNRTELFHRPEEWRHRSPLVLISAFCLLDNHLHLLVKEVVEGGISTFMSRFSKSITFLCNSQYGGQGSVFQGPYKSRLIQTDADLRNVGYYIVVKNTMERYPGGGLSAALENFEDAFDWASKDNFSSFPDYAVGRNSPIIERNILSALFPIGDKFKKDAQEYIDLYLTKKEDEVLEDYIKDCMD